MEVSKGDPGIGLSSEERGYEWELELLMVNSILDLLRLAASSNSVPVLVEFWSGTLNGRIIGTFANNYGITKPDVFSFTLYDGEEKGSFLVYRADETGERYEFLEVLSPDKIVFPLIKLSSEPYWFSGRLRSSGIIDNAK
ncbi:MAG: hypothetical protein NZ992_05120 [Candidatus Korarchaeum sp.]|nr:hypothetical protein [Candidatus Korarchaeum sp.]MDW8035532.1 hypothetical protein [Candidatus Korarchaeum sp.]